MKREKNRLDKVLPEVKEWANDSFLPRGRIEAYINGQGHLALATIDLFRYGMLEIKKSLLEIDSDAANARKSMSNGFQRLIYSQIIDLNDVKVKERPYVYGLDELTHFSLGALASGRSELVEPFYKEICDSINGEYGVHDGHKPPVGSTLRYAAFGLSIIGDWLGKPMDLDKHALPRDPAWGQLVAHWREPNLEKFLTALLIACDTHIERIAVTDNEANNKSKQFEFDSVFLAVYPAEILAVLRLRDMLGLANPESIDHPLMQTPYATITSLPDEVTTHDELLEKFLDMVRQRDPQVLPAGF